MRLGEFSFGGFRRGRQVDLEDCSPVLPIPAADFPAVLLNDPIAGA
jgi:hypothetical protein